MNDHEELIRRFKKVGLSTNEAKAYIALIKESPVTGYQLARNCGIVRSMIYEVLGKLMDKGGVTVIKGRSDLYSPLAPEEFLSRLEREYKESAEFIKLELNKDFTSNFGDYFFNIQGRENMVGKALEMIMEAKEEIFISLGNAEFKDEIAPELRKAGKRGVRIVIFTFMKLETEVGEVYSFGIPAQAARDIFHNDRVIIAVDRKEVLIGQSSNISDTKTIWTKNDLLTSVAVEHIKHDITLLRLRHQIGNQEFARALEEDDRQLDRQLLEILDMDKLQLDRS